MCDDRHVDWFSKRYFCCSNSYIEISDLYSVLLIILIWKFQMILRTNFENCNDYLFFRLTRFRKIEKCVFSSKPWWNVWMLMCRSMEKKTVNLSSSFNPSNLLFFMSCKIQKQVSKIFYRQKIWLDGIDFLTNEIYISFW